MTVNEGLAAVLAALGLAEAIQTFFLVPLPWKLVGITVGAFVVVGVAVSRLKSWSRPHQAAGFRRRSSGGSRATKAAGILLVVCLLFAIVAYWVVRVNVIRIDVHETTGSKSTFVFHGAMQRADTLTLQIPSPPECVPVDVSASGRYRADVEMIDWESLNPRLQVSNFSAPQLLGVQCMLSVNLDQLVIRVEPGSIEVFSPDRTTSYNLGIGIIGGILWLGAIFGLFSLPSRA